MGLLPWAVIERKVLDDPALNSGTTMMMQRKGDFASPLTALLAGIAVYEPCAEYFNQSLDSMWERNRISFAKTYPEIVIGAGLHAAIYCAARVSMGFPKPLVLEASDRVGGAFACSRTPAFYLNSRNRSGPLSDPGRSGGLNVLPGAPIQPSDISGGDYPTNTDLAFVIRATLALNANVVTNQKVFRVRSGMFNENVRRVYLRSGIATAKRVIIATGLGITSESAETGIRNLIFGENILSYEQFMNQMDGPFPFQGTKRWAVIGAGDSGRTVIEALIGQGPARHWSVASIDAPQSIDWYGCKQNTLGGWEKCNRRRYRDIGRAFASENGGILRGIARKAQSVEQEYDSVVVDGRPYDKVVICTGKVKEEIVGAAYGALTRNVTGKNFGRTIALESMSYPNVYFVGPVTGLGYEKEEVSNGVVNPKNTEGTTALYRFASRTATLASILD